MDKCSISQSRNEVNERTKKADVNSNSGNKEKVANVTPELGSERLLGV